MLGEDREGIETEPAIPEALDSGGSLTRFLVEDFGKQSFELRREFLKSWREGDLRADDVIDGLTVILRLKGRPSSHDFIEQYACSPNVHLFIVPSSCEHLRSSVVQSTSDGQHIELRPSSAVLPADAKIDQLQLGGRGIVENILKFDVAVDDCSLMEVVEGFEELLSDLPELYLAADLREGQSFCLDILHNQPTGMFFHVNVKCLVLNQVAMTQVFDQQEVAFEIRELLIIEHEGFDGVLLAAAPLDAAMHNTIGTLPEFLGDFVFLGKDLDVFEGGDHGQLIVLNTLPVIGKIIGGCLSMHAHLFLDHSLVLAEQCEPSQLAFNLPDAGISRQLAVAFEESGNFTQHTTLTILKIINTAAENVGNQVKKCPIAPPEPPPDS